MTVSTIGNAASELRRALDNQNKPASQTRAEKIPGTATLPTDQVATGAVPSEPVDLAEAIIQVQGQNLEAARSTLSDEDLSGIENGQSPQARVQAQAKVSVAVQTNKLPADLMQLLNE